MRKYQHLEQNPDWKFDWKSNLFKKTMPAIAFVNELTKNVMLSMEMILVKGFETADSIKTYFKF